MAIWTVYFMTGHPSSRSSGNNSAFRVGEGTTPNEHLALGEEARHPTALRLLTMRETSGHVTQFDATKQNFEHNKNKKIGLKALSPTSFTLLS